MFKIIDIRVKACLIALAFGLAHPSQAQVVLYIDVSNPANVTFTAGLANSAGAATPVVGFNAGISLENFFTSNENITLSSPLAIAGNWKARGVGAGENYNETVTFNYSDPVHPEAVVAGVDLSI